MDKALRPDRFNENPNSATGEKEFKNTGSKHSNTTLRCYHKKV